MTSLLRLLRLPGVYQALAFLTARRAVVRGTSMFPTLAPGEYVLFDRLAYRRAPPRRGDVVLATDPREPRRRIIKRVAAAPGETVTVDARTWTLGEGEWLLLGDAPEQSTDSRDFGPVGRASIQARAWFVYWPPGKVRRVRDHPHL
jgi:nickel-type superoxide dismutase maturation protease